MGGARGGGGACSRGGASPELGAENLTTKGSRLKVSSGSGYWYVSTTDTASFLGAKGGWVRRASHLLPRTLRPHFSPVNEQVHFLVLIPPQGLTAHVAVLVPRHAAEIGAKPRVKAPLQGLGCRPELPTLGPARHTC